MKHSTIYGRLFAFLITASTIAPYAQAKPITLAEDGTAKAVIVLPAAPTAVETFAANMLADGLNQITGGKFEVVKETSDVANANQPLISIGRTSLAANIELQGPEWKQSNREAFRILHRDNAVIIAGNPRSDIADQGALWGVNAFLMMQGMGIYLDDPRLGKVVSHEPTIVIDGLDITDAPAFSMRNGANTAAGYLQNYSAAKQDPLKEPHLFNRSASAHQQEFYHIYQQVVTPEVRQAHPDWFKGTHNPRYGSQPSPSTPPGQGGPEAGICLARPEIRKLFIDFIANRFRTNPDMYATTIVPDDYYLGFRCECDQCKRLTEIGGPPSFSKDIPRSSSDLQIDFVNAVAEGLKDEFPDRKLITLAYLDYIDPPKQTRVHPNVIIMIAPLQCPDELHPALEDVVRGWREMGAKTLYWYSYLLIRPPVPHLMREWVQNYKRWGVEGLYFETSLGITSINGLNCWLSSELMWNPDADVDALVNQFCQQMFGASAGHDMRKFFLAWETNTPAAMQDIPRLLESAEKHAGGPDSPEGKRVRLFKLGYEVRHSGYELDQALKRNDINEAIDIVRTAIKADQIIKRDYPEWGMKGNISLLNYVSVAGYGSIVLPALEKLRDAAPVNPVPETPVPGPLLCLTNNDEKSTQKRAGSSIGVIFSPSIDSKHNGRELFDGMLIGTDHSVYQYGAPVFIIDLDLRKSLQIEKIEVCTGSELMEGSLMFFQTVPMCIEVQVSDDGKEYRTVDRILPRTLRGFVSSNTLLATARYVRLVSTSLNQGHQIDEIKIWGRTADRSAR